MESKEEKKLKSWDVIMPSGESYFIYGYTEKVLSDNTVFIYNEDNSLKAIIPPNCLIIRR